MPETTTEAASAGAAIRAGVVVAGKYCLVDELGVGAMGVVWSATHQTLGHQVAIKFLIGSVMSSEEARARFDREARLAARLGEASRHITRVIDHGVYEDRVPYLVMELLRDESLSAMLKREKRIPLPLAARIVQQLSRALYVAHSAGVIHRDLKPANIFLCTPEQGDDVDVKLLDFGVAKATSESEDDHNTSQGQILGTPGYMSPEQVLSDKDIDARSDLWAVAAIVYKMVVGKSPFGGGGLQEIGMRIMSSEPVPPSQIWPDLPTKLDMWMQRGLAKAPNERFQSARELSDFLATVAGIASSPTIAGQISAAEVQQRILEAHDETSPSLRSTNGSQVRSTPPPLPRRRPAWVIPSAIGGVAVLVLLIVAVSSSGGNSESSTGQQPQGPATPTGPAQVQPVQPASVGTPVVTAAPTVAPSASAIASAASVAPSASAADPPAGKTAPVPVATAKPKTKVDSSGWGNKNEL